MISTLDIVNNGQNCTFPQNMLRSEQPLSSNVTAINVASFKAFLFIYVVSCLFITVWEKGEERNICLVLCRGEGDLAETSSLLSPQAFGTKLRSLGLHKCSYLLNHLSDPEVAPFKRRLLNWSWSNVTGVLVTSRNEDTGQWRETTSHKKKTTLWEGKHGALANINTWCRKSFCLCVTFIG